jgi:hypothetical protein
MFFPRHRPARKLTELFELRKERDAQLAEKRRVFGERALARAKARYDADPGNLLYGGRAARGGYTARDVDSPLPASSCTNGTFLGHLQQSTAPAATSDEAHMAGSVHA